MNVQNCRIFKMHWRYDDDVTDEKLIFQLLALSLVAATLSNVSQNCGQETYVYNVVPNNSKEKYQR